MKKYLALLYIFVNLNAQQKPSRICLQNSYLETNFKCENGGKKVVCYAQVIVAGAVLVHGILRGQGDAGDEDHQHDEVVKQLFGHNPVNCLANPEI